MQFYFAHKQLLKSPVFMFMFSLQQWEQLKVSFSVAETETIQKNNLRRKDLVSKPHPFLIGMICHEQAEFRKEKVQSIPNTNVNMYWVPPADINCNLGKVTHAYRSILKGTDRVYVVISNVLSDDLGFLRMIWLSPKFGQKIKFVSHHWYP